jgi:hypothetical protein
LIDWSPTFTGTAPATFGLIMRACSMPGSLTSGAISRVPNTFPGRSRRGGDLPMILKLRGSLSFACPATARPSPIWRLQRHGVGPVETVSCAAASRRALPTTRPSRRDSCRSPSVRPPEPGAPCRGPGVIALRGSPGHRLPLMALVPQWRQDHPNKRPPTRATAISAVGQKPPLALQKRSGDLRCTARHVALTAIGCPCSGLHRSNPVAEPFHAHRQGV